MTATERDREAARRQRIATVIGRRVLADGPDGEVDPTALVDAVDALVVQMLAAERARVLAPIQAVVTELAPLLAAGHDVSGRDLLDRVRTAIEEASQ